MKEKFARLTHGLKAMGLRLAFRSNRLFMTEMNHTLILVMHFKTVFSQHTTALSTKLVIILIEAVYGFQDMLTGKTMPIFVRLVWRTYFRIDRTPIHRSNVLVTLI